MKRQFTYYVLLFFVITCCKAGDGESETGNTSKITAHQSDGLPFSQEVSFDSIFKLGLSLLYTNPDSARKIVQSAYDRKLYENQWQATKSLNLIGATHHLQANYMNALDYYYQALEIASEINDSMRLGNIYNNIGNVNLKTGNYSSALSMYLKSESIYKSLKEERNKASSNNNIGLLYMDIDNYNKAYIQFKKALKGFQANDDSIGIAATLSNIGALKRKTGDFDSAMYFHERAISIDRKTENIYGLCVGSQEYAESLLEQNETEKAIQYYELSKSLAKQINQHFHLSIANLGLANANLKVGNLEKSVQYTDSAMHLAETLDNISLKQTANEMFSKIYTQTKNYQDALKYHLLSVELKDSLVNQTKLHQIYKIEIDQLNMAGEIQKLELQQKELSLSKKNNIIVFIIVLFVLIMAGAYLLYINHNHRRKAAHHAAILNLNEKKSRAAIEAEIQERKRIGLELHDGLGQLLTVARLNISVLQQKATLNEESRKELMDSAFNSVDEAFNELRNISHNLAPAALSEKGLKVALEELADQINKNRNQKFQLELYGLEECKDNLVENMLYRSVQELLNNALKHANANTFFLQIVKSETEITLMFEDNGRGFNTDNTKISNGSGLSNIRSRVENLHGSIFVDSKENRGTIVTIVIPIKSTTNES